MASVASSKGTDLGELLARTGPTGRRHTGWPNDDPDWAQRQAQAVLDKVIPAEFGSPKPDHRQVRQWVDQLIELGWPRRAVPVAESWLLLMGLPGRGKTHQAWGALSDLVRHAVTTTGRALQWRSVCAMDLADSLRYRGDSTNLDADQPYRNADLLMFDDLGSGGITGVPAEKIAGIIDWRYRHGLPTIYTTNLPVDQLDAALGGRTKSRVLAGAVVVIDGPDRRLAGGR